MGAGRHRSCARDHSPGVARLGVAASAGLALLAFWLLLGATPGRAVSVGGAICPIGGGDNSLTASDSLIDLGRSTVGVELTPEGGTADTVAVIGPSVDMADLSLKFGLDVDGDGIADLDGRIRLRLFVALRFGGGGVTWQHWAVRHMRNQGWHIPDVLASEYGRAYPDNPTLAGFFDWFSKYFLELTLTKAAAAGAVDVPRGRMALVFRAARVLGGTREYSFSLDTSSAGGPPERATAWPHRTQVGVFVDLGTLTSLVSDWHFLAAVGLRTADAAGSEVPWDAMRLGVRFADVKEISLAYENPPAGASGRVGFPGDAAVALEHACSPATGLDANLVLSHQEPTTGAVPERAVLRYESVDESGERAMYLRAGLADPARVVGVRLTQAGPAGDVNGDGYTDFATDRILVRRSADRTTRAAAVLEAFDATGDDSADVYLALDAPLPPRLTADLSGAPVPGAGGAVEKPLDVADVRACDSDWGTPACDATLAALTEARVRFTNVVPADVDGEPPLDFLELSPLPSEIGRPAPARFVRADLDGPAGTYAFGGDVAGLRRFRLDRTDGDLRVDTVTDGSSDPVGAEAHYTNESGTATMDEHGVLDALPATLALTADTDDVLADGDPVRVGWEASTAITAHVAARHSTLGVAAPRETYVLAHATLPAVSAIALALDSAASPHSAAWTASAPTAGDLGLATRALGAPTLWAHATATLPPEFRVAWSDEGDYAAFDACVTGPGCGSLDLLGVLGETFARDAGYWPVDAPFHGFDLAPAELLATAGDHFAPAAVDFVDVTGDVPAREWEAGAAVTGVQQVAYSKDADGDTRVAVRNAGSGPLGFAADTAGGGAALDLWGVLARRPSTAAVEFNTAAAAQHVDWEMSSPTGAVAAADILALDAGLGLRATSAAGWIGSGLGLTDGIPAAARLDLDTPGRRLGWEASAPTKLDVGAATNERNAAGDATVLWARLRAELPERLAASWTDAPEASVKVTTCTAPGSCAPGKVEVTGGMDDGAAVGLWPLTTPFASPRPAPPEIAATTAGHFVAAPAEFVDVAGDPLDDPWTLSARLELPETVEYRFDPVADRTDFEVETGGGAQLGVSADVSWTTPAGGTRTVSAWGALAAVPDNAKVSYASPTSVATWDLSARSAAAFAVSYENGNLGTVERTAAAGWIGSGTGAADGVPLTATLDLDLPPGPVAATWSAGGSAAVEAGYAADVVGLGAEPLGWAHVRAVLPAYAAVSVKKGDRVAFTTCPPGLGCTPVPALVLRGGVDRTRAPGWWPLSEPFSAFAGVAVPAELAATAAAHFPTAAAEFARVDGSIPADLWTGEVQTTAVKEASLAEKTVVAAGVKTVTTTAELHRTPPGGPAPALGLALDVEDAPADTVDAWGVVARLPADLTVDLARTRKAGGDALDVTYDTGGVVTGAALAATLRRGGGAPADNSTLAAAGWLGSGDGSTDGIPDTARVQVDPGGRTDPAVPFASWTASGTVHTELGAAYRTAEMAAADELLWSRVVTDVPDHLSVFLAGAAGKVRGGRVEVCTVAEVLAGCPGMDVVATLAHESETAAGHADVGYWALTEALAPARPDWPAELASARPDDYVRVDADVDTVAPGERWDVRADLRTPVIDELGVSFDVPDGSRKVSLAGRARAAGGGPARFLLDATGRFEGADSRGEGDARMVLDSLPERVAVDVVLPGSSESDNLLTRLAWDDTDPTPLGLAVTGRVDTNPTGAADPAKVTRGALIANTTVPTTGSLRVHRGQSPLPTPGDVLVAEWNASAAAPLDAGVSWGTEADLTGGRVHAARLTTSIPRRLRLLAVDRPLLVYTSERKFAFAACAPTDGEIDDDVVAGTLGVDESDCDSTDATGLYGIEAAPLGVGNIGYWPVTRTADSPGAAPAALAATQADHFVVPAPPATDSVVADESSRQASPTAPDPVDDRLAKYSVRLTGLRLASYAAKVDESAGWPKSTHDLRVRRTPGGPAFVLDATRRTRDATGVDALRTDRAYAALSGLPARADASVEIRDRGSVDGTLEGKVTWDTDARPVAGLFFDRLLDPTSVAAAGLGEHDGYQTLSQIAAWAGTAAGDALPPAGDLSFTLASRAAAPDLARVTLDTPSGVNVAVDAAFAMGAWKIPPQSQTRWHTHGRVQAELPSHLDAFWRHDTSGDMRADLVACTDPDPDDCDDSEKIRDMKMSQVHEPWYTPALEAPLSSFPFIADSTPAGKAAFPAFGDPDWEGGDFARYVRRQVYPYPLDEKQTRVEVSGKLDTLAAASFGERTRDVAATPSPAVPLRTVELCLAGEPAGGELALRSFSEDRPAVVTDPYAIGLTYVNTTLKRMTGAGFAEAGPVALAAELNLPHLEDAPSGLDMLDVDSNQRDALDGSPLLYLAQRPCSAVALADHASDPVVTVAPEDVPTAPWHLLLTGLLRSGTWDGVDVVRDRARLDFSNGYLDTEDRDLLSPGELTPGDPGLVDVAALTEDYTTSTPGAPPAKGLQVAANWRVARAALVHQPVVSHCGKGTQGSPAVAWAYDVCKVERRAYDSEDRWRVEARVRAKPAVSGDVVARLSLTLVGDESELAGTRVDAKYVTQHVYVAGVPASFDLGADLVSRERDGRLSVAANLDEVAGSAGALDEVVYRAWNDYGQLVGDERRLPPRLVPPELPLGTDPPDPDDPNTFDVPATFLVFTEVPSRLHARFDAWLGSGGSREDRTFIRNGCFGGADAHHKTANFDLDWKAKGDTLYTVDQNGDTTTTAYATKTTPPTDADPTFDALVDTVNAWTPAASQPRSDSEIRSPYVHGSFNLGDAAQDVELDLGTYRTRRYNRAAGAPAGRAYEDATDNGLTSARLRARTLGGTPKPVSGTLRALLPGFVVDRHKVVEPGPRLLGLDACVDMDLPLELNLAGASSLDLVDMSANLRLESSPSGAASLRFREATYSGPHAPDELPATPSAGAYHWVHYARLTLLRDLLTASDLMEALNTWLTSPVFSTLFAGLSVASNAMNRNTYMLQRLDGFAPVEHMDGSGVVETNAFAELTSFNLFDMTAQKAPAATVGTSSPITAPADVTLNPILPGVVVPSLPSMTATFWKLIWGTALAPDGVYAPPGPAGVDVGKTAADDGGGSLTTIALDKDANAPDADTLVGDEERIATLDDGTDVFLRVLFNRHGNVEVWLVGSLDSDAGPVGRFAKKILAGKNCFGVEELDQVSLEIDYTVDVASTGAIRLSGVSGTWTDGTDGGPLEGLEHAVAENGTPAGEVLLSDASGDMGWTMPGDLSLSTTSVPPGDEVDVTVPTLPPGPNGGCYLLPGDGRRLYVGWPSTKTVRYQWPGQYEVFMVCYGRKGGRAGLVYEGGTVTVTS